MTDQPALPIAGLEREIHLRGGRRLEVSREFEKVRVKLTHKVRPKQGKPHMTTDETTARTLEQAVLGALSLDYPNDESRLVVDYVRSTSWGAGLP